MVLFDLWMFSSSILQTPLRKKDHVSAADIATITAELAAKQVQAMRYNLLKESLKSRSWLTVRKAKDAWERAAIFRKAEKYVDTSLATSNEKIMAAAEDVARLIKDLFAANL